MPTAIDRFDGDFDFLPTAAHLRYGSVHGEFQRAAVSVADDLAIHPEAHWHLEACRERALRPTRSLNDAMRDINGRVATRLYDLVTAQSKGNTTVG